MGLRPSDCFVVPLCADCHLYEQHRVGEREFWAKRGLDPLHLADLLWEDSGDTEKAMRALLDWRMAA